jgi:colicin import membrane protein
LSALWTEAQELANEALHVAQTAWNAERAQAEKLRVELLSAFETQGAGFEALRLKLAASERSRGESAQQVVALTDQAHTANARAQEIGEYGTYDGQVPGGGGEDNLIHRPRAGLVR